MFRVGIVKRLQELLPILVQICDDMHVAYRIVADAIAYAQTRGGPGVVVWGRLHQPPPQFPCHADGHTPTVDEVTVAVLIEVSPSVYHILRLQDGGMPWCSKPVWLRQLWMH